MTGLPGQLSSSNNSLAALSRRYPAIGMGIHLAGFAGEGLILLGAIGFDSGAATLEPIGDGIYGLGLVIVVAAAARAGVSMKSLIAAGSVIGMGIFYKSAVHEIHIASGIGFRFPHTAHIVLGANLITLAAAALVVLAIRRTRTHGVQVE